MTSSARASSTGDTVNPSAFRPDGHSLFLALRLCIRCDSCHKISYWTGAKHWHDEASGLRPDLSDHRGSDHHIVGGVSKDALIMSVKLSEMGMQWPAKCPLLDTNVIYSPAT
jgi:hypothetical protein